MGVLAGILTGLLAGFLYNRFHNIRLPEFLAFFGGKRFVPIATGLTCLIIGVALGWIWAPVQQGVNAIGNWLVTSGPIGPFVYGILNVIFRVVGLHHIVNSLVWFVFGSYTTADSVVVTGDIHRFFAGDPSAGAFLTTFLTGITEPVEYTFLFLAPVLYGVHALLPGGAMAVCQILGIKIGFTFSAGLIDYVLLFATIADAANRCAVVYYVLFRFFISRFNLATQGREESDESISPPVTSTERAAAYLLALGGKQNLTRIDACITRLRLEIVRMNDVQETELKKLGAMGIAKRGDSGLQIIVGTQAEIIAGEIRELVNQ